MKYFLTQEAVLKWLEMPSVYHIKKDELYELDDDSFPFLKKCMSESGCNTEDSEFMGHYQNSAPFIEYCLKEGILTKDKIAVKRPPLIKSSQPSLRYLELQITDRCNLKCRHCYIGDTSEAPRLLVGASMQGKFFPEKIFKELSLNQIKKDFA
ncbi:MAG: hypothetical protein FJ241_06250 [Nitrospira sp.]|nr:hypothetical protein [Nitrospira sp.]